MNFEDMEELKHNFTLHSITPEFFSPRQQTTLILRKRNVTYTRVYTVPQGNTNQSHLKKLISSLLSKLRFNRA